MSLERRDVHLGSIGLGDSRSAGSLTQNGSVVFVTDSNLVMDINDLLVRMTVSTAGEKLITLPSVKEAAGRIYTIYAISVATGTMKAQDKNDDAGLTDLTFTTGQYSVLYSDGYMWHVLVGQTS
jgi:hypothetical protein